MVISVNKAFANFEKNKQSKAFLRTAKELLFFKSYRFTWKSFQWFSATMNSFKTRNFRPFFRIIFGIVWFLPFCGRMGRARPGWFNLWILIITEFFFLVSGFVCLNLILSWMSVVKNNIYGQYGLDMSGPARSIPGGTIVPTCKVFFY